MKIQQKELLLVPDLGISRGWHLLLSLKDEKEELTLPLSPMGHGCVQGSDCKSEPSHSLCSGEKDRDQGEETKFYADHGDLHLGLHIYEMPTSYSGFRMGGGLED